MKKKPRKPQMLFWYGAKLWATHKEILVQTMEKSPAYRGARNIPMRAAKRLSNWLHKAYAYVEANKK